MEIVDKINKLISSGKTDVALNELCNYLQDKDKDLHNQALMQKSAYTRTSRDASMGLLSFSEANQAYARVNAGVLGILNQIRDGVDLQGGNATQSTNSSNSNQNDNKKIKILFLASNPSDTGKLALTDEFQKIYDKLQNGKKFDNFQLFQKFAVTSQELLSVIIQHKPDIIHFSGHGLGKSGKVDNARDIDLGQNEQEDSTGIVLQDSNGLTKIVKTDALANMFKTVNKISAIKAVILNACYSENQAKAIVQSIPFVIGMNKAIKDEVALTFATGFYLGLADGLDIETSYDLGKVQIEIEGESSDLAILHKKEN